MAMPGIDIDRDLMPNSPALLDATQTVLTDAEGGPQQVAQRLAEMLIICPKLQPDDRRNMQGVC